ncbi:sensor histidine kinase [Eubacterium oxidoreducens]|uniref:Oxygen sensor histidine kinase NreB n=1 Tax=Eubacterium oxidoreducens TaxID=1732 RepID=A0A1G6CQ20_EUBOX|nr:sensor histidine kinase [Eubacterium oxidoreducens]SDB34914.1 two-component system, NarL family, sensor histidine kinase DegS [Eubacterium oxidoreducens]
MVRDFLQDYYDDLNRKKSQLSKQSRSLKKQIDDYNLKIAELESAKDHVQVGFTPTGFDEKDAETLSLLKREVRKYSRKQDHFLKEIEEIDSKLLLLSHEIDQCAVVVEGDVNNDLSFVSEVDPINAALHRKILESQEMERQRIARDLHDSTVQTLTSFVHKMELCSRLMEIDQVRCKLEMKIMNNQLRSSIEELREIIYNLRPMSFDDIGLDVTAQRMLDHLAKKSPTATSFKFISDGNLNDIPQVISLTLLHIMEESCNNALKYANASLIEVSMINHDGLIEVMIRDDGDGFDQNEVASKKTNDATHGFGMSIMKERVFLLNGSLLIESKPGNGTIVKITVPLKKED